jgi:branched-chain amino acid transport system permease protein
VPAGAAGVVFAAMDGFVSPASFTLTTAILVLAAVVVGGRGTMYGPLIGTWILVEAQQRLLTFSEFTLLVFGAFLIAAAVVAPRGVVGTIRRFLPATLRRPFLDHWAGTRDQPVVLGPEVRADLEVVGATKRFGGITALDDVALRAASGEVTALIGPNGSGKTTLLNAICGYYRLDAGTVTLGDQGLQGLRPDQIARKGVGRTFQTPRLPDDLTVRETVATAAFSSRRARLLSTGLRLPRWRREEREIAARVDEVLGELGLRGDAEVLATSLPLGKKRLLEIARAVMMRPPLLVLDEAASGLDPSETQRLGQLLGRLAAEGTTVLLVEHNMDLVMTAAQRVFVLADGALLTAGAPAEVAVHSEVLAVYLGKREPLEEVRS